MRIRDGRAGDAEECLKLQTLDNEAFWEASDFWNSAHHDDVIFLVAEEGNELLGYILGYITPTRRSEALIHETRVHRRMRRKGIGTKLVNAFCEKSFEKEAKVVLAETGPEGISFYCDACGFKEVNKWIEVARRKGQT
jgi:ribosomal protein S18 acetylase RimI-like enzyme